MNPYPYPDPNQLIPIPTFFFFGDILTSPVDNGGKKKNRATP